MLGPEEVDELAGEQHLGAMARRDDDAQGQPESVGRQVDLKPPLRERPRPRASGPPFRAELRPPGDGPRPWWKRRPHSVSPSAASGSRIGSRTPSSTPAIVPAPDGGHLAEALRQIAPSGVRTGYPDDRVAKAAIIAPRSAFAPSAAPNQRFNARHSASISSSRMMSICARSNLEPQSAPCENPRKLELRLRH